MNFLKPPSSVPMQNLSLLVIVFANCLLPTQIQARIPIENRPPSASPRMFWKVLPTDVALLVNGTNRTVYLVGFDQNPQSPDAHGTLITIVPGESTSCEWDFVVLSKEYADDQTQYSKGTLVNYELEGAERYLIKFDDVKNEWFIVHVST
jgi:hypothetical protein